MFPLNGVSFQNRVVSSCHKPVGSFLEVCNRSVVACLTHEEGGEYGRPQTEGGELESIDRCSFAQAFQSWSQTGFPSVDHRTRLLASGY